MNLQTVMLAALTIAILTLMLAHPLQTIYAQEDVITEVPIQGLGNETVETPVNVTEETPTSNVTN